MLTGRWSTMWALARRLAVRLDVAGVWLEPKAAVDAACRVRGLGDDDPAVAGTIGGPLCGDAEKVGSQPAPPVLVLGADALITRCAAAPDNAQVCDECVAGERTEGGSYVPLGQRTSRIRLCLGKSLGCGSPEGTSCGLRNGVVGVAGLVDASVFLGEVVAPVRLEVAVAA